MIDSPPLGSTVKNPHWKLHKETLATRQDCDVSLGVVLSAGEVQLRILVKQQTHSSQIATHILYARNGTDISAESL